MIDLDRWMEIFETLRTAKLRTAATALAVAWGIFMMVILLAAGRGIQNGVRSNFEDDATNSLWIYSDRTTKAHGGYQKGRVIRFDNRDYQAMLTDLEEVDHHTGRFYLSGEFTVRHGREVAAFEVRACHPGHRYIEGSIITSGRFINDVDVRERRKVVVIGPQAVKLLFKGRDSIGKWIEVRGTPYLVVGVFKDEGWEGENSKIYIPISTAQTAYGGGDRVHQMMFTIGDASLEQSQRIADRAKRLLAARHGFSLDDEKAVNIRNNVEGAQRFISLFDSIQLFVFIVGAGTMLAGIVGVSNIMLIAVRERTKEIGIRRALGATASMIVRQIVLEALLITSASGLIGLLTGLGIIEVVRSYVPPNDVFRNPEVNLAVVIGATLVLIVCGVLAGYFPARLASRINPVEALRAS
ncbi:MAG TPA: ABC transporter permease [Polyangiaceae bacterium]|nr:ABC transporter permease [Polyangiaceae bacterium]